MKISTNDGVIREATTEEIALYTQEMEPLPYKERVIARIRGVYSLDDEIAILRQRDTKPEEFEAYSSFVEKIKKEEKAK